MAIGFRRRMAALLTVVLIVSGVFWTIPETVAKSTKIGSESTKNDMKEAAGAIEKENTEIRSKNILFSTVKPTEIRRFLQKIQSPLANYREAFGNKTKDAAELFTIYNSTLKYDFNPRVLAVMLERSSRRITEGIVVANGQNPAKEEYKKGPLAKEIEAAARELEKGVSEGECPVIASTHGAKRSASSLLSTDRSNLPDLGESSTRLLRRSLAKGSLAPRNDICIDFDGPFTQTYENWFGKAEESHLISLTAIDEPFLEKPFNWDDFCGITSFFDHQYPIYSSESSNSQDSITIFTGETIGEAANTACIEGKNCYSGHGGMDYLVRDCGTYQGKTVLSAAEGKIEKVIFDSSDMGNVVYLGHDRDGDGRPDYRTRYMHLKSIRDDLDSGIPIETGKNLGISGTTGNSTGVHLHFDTARLETDSAGNIMDFTLVDPYSWWGNSADPWEQYNGDEGQSLYLWKTDTLVDDRDPGFEVFAKAGNDFQWKDAPYGYGNGQSLWNITSESSVSGPDAWAFWAGELPEAGKYMVKAYIPALPESYGTLTNEAHYLVYSLEGVKDVKIDQKANAGSWVSLGTYSFESGINASVTLQNEGQSGKIISADSVQWEKMEEKRPELSFLNDSVAMTDTGGGQYQVSFQIKNDGNADAENVVICFGIGQEKCVGQTSITSVSQGQTSEKSKIRLSVYAVPSSGDIGTLRIQSQNPEDANESNNSFTVSLDKLVTTTAPGGVDFSAIDLSGFEITKDAIDLVIQAVEGSEGGEDAEESQDFLKKIFLTALTVPNDRQWVSLGKGVVDIQSPMEKTDMGRVMLSADLALKYDMAEEMIPLMSTLYSDWKNMVVTSAFWKELKSKGFNSYPYFQGSIVVVPGSVSVNETDGKLMVTASALSIESRLDYFAIETSAYRLSAEAENEIQNLLNQWQTKVTASLLEAVSNLEQKIQTDAAYRDIRKALPMVALAHWYKTLPRENLPYADLIDTNAVDGLESEVPFDKTYWESQSWQALGTFDVPSYYGSTYRATWYGAVELSAASSDKEGPLTEREEGIFQELMENLSYVEEDDQYFFRAGSMKKSNVDLSGYLEFQDPYLYTGKNVAMTVTIVNGGEPVSENFQYVLFETDGSGNTYIIDKKTLGGLSGAYTSTVSWKIPDIAGDHEFSLEIDTADMVSEDTESNNIFIKKMEIEPPYPIVEILSPEEGAYVGGNTVKFSAMAEDPQEGLLDGARLEWRSDVDGLLESGSTITVAHLSAGAHNISVKAVDSDGFFDEKTVPIYVPEPGVPEIRVTSPIENARFPLGRDIVFMATASDFEDGELTGSQMMWESDLDGFLGLGERVNADGLREGEHTVTITVFDFDGNIGQKNIHIFMEKGTPILSITQPVDENTYFEHENVALEATATDLQDGDLGSSIEWHSSRDDLLGKGAKIEVTLSAGEHIITASVRDKDGEYAEESRSVTIFHTPPTINILAPENNSDFDYFDKMTLQASATDIQDGELGDEAMSWQSDLNGYLGQGKTITVSKLIPGDHVITAQAMDSDGAVSEAKITLRIILDPPTAAMSEPSEGATFYVGQEIVFKGQAEDQKDGMLISDSLTWYSSRNGEFAKGENASFSGLSEGEHVIELRAKDSDGWIGVDSREITVLPNSYPQIAVVSPVSGEKFVNGNTVIFRAKATDAEDGALNGASIQWESSRDGQLGEGERLELSNLSIGEHEISLAAKDRFGVSTKTSFSITILNRPPDITIVSPEETQNIFSSTQSVTLTAEAVDLEDGNVSGNIVWTSNINGNLGNGGEITVSALLSGTHAITANITDSAGNVSQASISIRMVDPQNELLTVFSDGEEEKTFQYGKEGGSETATIPLPAETKITTAQMDISGKEANSSLNEDAGPYITGIERAVPAFADIDSDSDRDLFIGTAEGKLKFYRNIGSALHADFALESEDYGGVSGDGAYIAPAFIDIDADSDLDLFTGKDDGTLNFYRNNGTTWNLENSAYADIDVGFWATPAFTDIDADSDLDLFIGSSEGPITFYRNDGSRQNPLWTKVASHSLSSKYHQFGTLTFADLDLDSDQDLILGQYDSRIYYYRNDGNAQNPVWKAVTENLANFYMGENRADTYPAPALLDMDGDSDLDLFFGERDGVINVAENTGSASAPAWNSYRDFGLFIDVGYMAAPTFVDIDADSDLDLVIGEEQNSSKYANETLNFYRNNGGIWQWETGNFAATADRWIDYPTPIFVDIDGDSDLDLFMGQRSGTLVFYRNDGNTYEPAWTMVSDTYQNIDVGSFSRPALADIDGDADLDLFIGNNNGTIYFYQNNGTKQSPIWTFITDQYADISLGQTGTALVFTDMDEDADFDLVIGKTPNLLWYKNIGTASEALWELENEMYGDVTLNGPMPTFADTDNDGDMDLYIGDAAGGLNMLSQNAPKNPQIFIGNEALWTFEGEFHGRQTVNDFSEMVKDVAEIPLTVISEGAGILEISNLNIQYAKEDLEPPILSVASFAGNGLVLNPLRAGATGHVNVRVTDNEEVASVTLEWRGETQNLQSMGGSIFEGDIVAPMETGKYTLMVRAIDRSGLSAELSEEIKVVADGVDLEISAMTISPESAEEGQKMTIEAVVENFGMEEARFFVEIQKDDEFVDRKEVFVDGAGAENVSFEWMAEVSAGNLKMILDPENEIAEFDETNNIAENPVNVKDITPPVIEVVGFPNFAWVDETIEVEILAQDSAGVASAEVVFSDGVHALTNNGEYLLTQNEISGNFTANIPLLPAGKYQAAFSARDANGLATTETREIEIAEIKPDLEIVRFSEESAEMLEVTMKNTGRAAAENIAVMLSENGTVLPDGQRYVTLAGGAENTLTFTLEPTVGSKNMEITIDPNDQIPERDETNNHGSLIFTSQTVEPISISEIEKPEYLVENENFTLKVALEGQKSRQNELSKVSVFTKNETFDLLYNEATGQFEAPLVFSENGKTEMTVRAEKPDGFYQYFEGVSVHAEKPDIALSLLLEENGMWLLKAENIGGTAVENIRVNFMVDGAGEETKTLNRLDRGEAEEIAFEWEEEEGSHNLVFQADPENTVEEDNEVNNMVARVKEVPDTEAPMLGEVVMEKWYEGASNFLRVQASDNKEIAEVAALVEGGESALLNTTEEGWYEGFLTIPEGLSGEKELIVSVRDASGLEASLSMVVEILPSLPDVEIVNIQPGSVIGGQEVEMTVQIRNRGGSDAGEVPVRLEMNGVYQDEKALSLAAGEEKDVTLKYSAPEGSYQVKVIADPENIVNEGENETNNVMEKEFEAFDLSAPEKPEILSASEGWLQSDAVVSWAEVDQAVEYWYRIDEGVWKNIGENLSVALVDLSDGKHRVEIMAKDSAENESSAAETEILIDKTPPETPITQKPLSSWQKNASQIFMWNAPKDQGSGVDHYEGMLDEEAVGLGSDTFYQVELASGLHTWKVRAVDKAENVGEWSDAASVRIDVDAPETPVIQSETHPDPEKAEENRAPEFQWNVPEDISGVAGFFYLFTNSPNSEPSEGGFWLENTENSMQLKISSIPTPFESEGVPDGTWYFHLRAKDNAGNVSEKSTYIIRVKGKKPWQWTIFGDVLKAPDVIEGAIKRLKSW